jgi:hypothetical protein
LWHTSEDLMMTTLSVFFSNGESNRPLCTWPFSSSRQAYCFTWIQLTRLVSVLGLSSFTAPSNPPKQSLMRKNRKSVNWEKKRTTNITGWWQVYILILFQPRCQFLPAPLHLCIL